MVKWNQALSPKRSASTCCSKYVVDEPNRSESRNHRGLKPLSLSRRARSYQPREEISGAKDAPFKKGITEPQRCGKNLSWPRDKGVFIHGANQYQKASSRESMKPTSPTSPSGLKCTHSDFLPNQIMRGRQRSPSTMYGTARDPSLRESGFSYENGAL